jgi:hypothetical protein
LNAQRRRRYRCTGKDRPTAWSHPSDRLDPREPTHPPLPIPHLDHRPALRILGPTRGHTQKLDITTQGNRGETEPSSARKRKVASGNPADNAGRHGGDFAELRRASVEERGIDASPKVGHRRGRGRGPGKVRKTRQDREHSTGTLGFTSPARRRFIMTESTRSPLAKRSLAPRSHSKSISPPSHPSSSPRARARAPRRRARVSPPYHPVIPARGPPPEHGGSPCRTSSRPDWTGLVQAHVATGTRLSL